MINKYKVSSIIWGLLPTYTADGLGVTTSAKSTIKPILETQYEANPRIKIVIDILELLLQL